MQTLNFIVIFEEPPPAKGFSLKNLPGASKIDVVCRNLLTLFSKKKFDYYINYFAVFTKKQPAVFIAKELPLKAEPYDEIAVASHIQEARQKEMQKFDLKTPPEQAFAFTTINDFTSFIDEILKGPGVGLYLTEVGKHYTEVFDTIIQQKTISIFLGGRKDISEEHEQELLANELIQVSLGPEAYLATSCILKTLFELEKRLASKH